MQGLSRRLDHKRPPRGNRVEEASAAFQADKPAVSKHQPSSNHPVWPVQSGPSPRKRQRHGSTVPAGDPGRGAPETGKGHFDRAGHAAGSGGGARECVDVREEGTDWQVEFDADVARQLVLMAGGNAGPPAASKMATTPEQEDEQRQGPLRQLDGEAVPGVMAHARNGLPAPSLPLYEHDEDGDDVGEGGSEGFPATLTGPLSDLPVLASFNDFKEAKKDLPMRCFIEGCGVDISGEADY
jgi:hypothetical protein